MPLPRRALSLLITAAVLLCLGVLVARGVSGALGISFTPVTAPAEHPTAAEAHPVAAVPALTTVAVPPDPRVTLAAQAVAAAFTQRGAAAPALAAPGTAATGLVSGSSRRSLAARRRSGSARPRPVT